LVNFIRYCADDWKALYFEGRLAMKPGVTGDDVARWFWGETAAGQVLRRVRDRLDASEDPRWKAAAFGGARYAISWGGLRVPAGPRPGAARSEPSRHRDAPLPRTGMPSARG